MYAIGLTYINKYYAYVYLYTVNLDTAEFTQVGDSNIGGTRTNYGVATLACDLDRNLYCVERGSQMAEFYKLSLWTTARFVRRLEIQGVRVILAEYSL